MARTTFARTVVITHCEVMYIDAQNEQKQGKVDLFGNYDTGSASKAAAKKLGAKGCVVTDISHESFYGSMNIEEFAKYCDKKNRKEW